MADLERSLGLTRRKALRLLAGALGVVAGMSVSGGAAHAVGSPAIASATQAARALAALVRSDRYGRLVDALQGLGFRVSGHDAQPTLLQGDSILVTLRADGSSAARAAFIAGWVSGATYEVQAIFATHLERAGAAGTLTTFHARPDGGVASARRLVQISRRCPPGQVCTEAIPGDGGCAGCCGGWYQVSYARCSGCTQYNCVALQRSCCCCNNAAQCWYEQTGESCSYYCTSGCGGDCGNFHNTNLCGCGCG